MDLLNGKAKKAFFKWLKIRNKYNEFDNIVYLFIIQDNLLKNALIIEWFDSVGIYIETFNEFGEFGISIHKGDYRNPIESIGHWKTRQEATIQAIKKANQIYNESILNRN